MVSLGRPFLRDGSLLAQRSRSWSTIPLSRVVSLINGRGGSKRRKEDELLHRNDPEPP